MNNRRFRHNRIGGLLMALCLLLGLCANAVGEGGDVVRLPVTATGADCVALLLDDEGAQLQRLELHVGATQSFELPVYGLNTWHYRIRLADEDTDKVIFDRTEYNVTVKTTLDEQGRVVNTIVAQPVGATGEDGKVETITFANTLVPDIEPAFFDPPVTKRISGDAPATHSTFTFVMSAISGPEGVAIPMPGGATAQQVTLRIEGAGQGEFGRITFDHEGTYTYNIFEQRTDAAGYTYDTSIYTVTAVVTREGHALRADVSQSLNGAAVNAVVFDNVYAETTPTPTPTVTPSPTPTRSNTSPRRTPEPTPTPIPRTVVRGQKVWLDDGNAHGARPSSVTVRLYADGEPVRATPTWGDRSGDTWSYAFENLPALRGDGTEIEYTVDEAPVQYYQTTIDGTTITNALIPQTTRDYVTVSGTKFWFDSGYEAGRPASVTVRLLRDGEAVDSRALTAADGWQYDFGRLPADDGYGHTYAYSVQEDSVPSYFVRVKGYDIANVRLPDTDRPGTKTFSDLTVEEMEQLIEQFGYDVATWGPLLPTGDEMPIYPYVFGGIGLAAVLILLIFGRKRRGKGR